MRSFKDLKSLEFIGKQLSRLKLGQLYYTIAISTVNAISLVTLAFEIQFWLLVLLFPMLLLGAYIVGYYMDKKDIITKDMLRTNDIYYRYLSTSDFKS